MRETKLYEDWEIRASMEWIWKHTGGPPTYGVFSDYCHLVRDLALCQFTIERQTELEPETKELLRGFFEGPRAYEFCVSELRRLREARPS